jgi:hypothetical protein
MAYNQAFKEVSELPKVVSGNQWNPSLANEN